MHYSIEQDEKSGKYVLFDTDTNKKVKEFETRREATREMGRLQRLEDANPPKKKDEDEEEDD